MASTFIQLPPVESSPGGVESFNSRTGAVVPLAPDYASFYFSLDGSVPLTGPITSADTVVRIGVADGSPSYVVFNVSNNNDPDANTFRFTDTTGGGEVDVLSGRGDGRVIIPGVLQVGSITTGGVIDVGGNKIENLADGSQSTDAATFGQLQAMSGLVEAIRGSFETPTDRTYTLDLYAAYAYQIETLRIITSSGTATVKLQIDGVDVTGVTAVAVSSTIALATATAARAVAAGAKLTMVVSDSAAPADMDFDIKTTRT